MTLLVFGKTGQVAQELQRRAPGATFLSRAEADLSDPAACAAAILAASPSAVINAAAYTAVDKAEDDEAAATVINGDSPAAMAETCAALKIPFVQISTDYVFEGGGMMPFAPDAPTAPLSAYGRSKLAGEEAIEGAGGIYAILRTSWVFSAHGGNFVKTMLRLAQTRDRLTVVSDQIGGPTAAGPIADACLTAAAKLADDPSLTGTYHFAGSPDVSWADFARAIFALTGQRVEVADIPTTDYPTPARRPANSRMDCSTLARLGLSRPDWHRDLTQVLTELGAIS